MKNVLQFKTKCYQETKDKSLDKCSFDVIIPADEQRGANIGFIEK